MRQQTRPAEADSELEWRMPSGEDLVAFALAVGASDDGEKAPAGEDSAGLVEALWTGGS